MTETEKVERLARKREFVLWLLAGVYALILLHLAGLLETLPGELWTWYLDKLEHFPLKTVFVTLEIFTGFSALIVLRSQIPSRARVTANGGTFVGHFLIQTVFWIGIMIEFPLAILLTIYGAPLYAHLAVLAGLFLMIVLVFATMWSRPKFKPAKFRVFFAPLITMVTPGISAINRLHVSRMLPESASNVIEWLATVFQRGLLGAF